MAKEVLLVNRAEIKNTPAKPELTFSFELQLARHAGIIQISRFFRQALPLHFAHLWQNGEEARGLGAYN